MPKMVKIPIEKWEAVLLNYLSNYKIFAPLKKGIFTDYEFITEKNFKNISYNSSKPVTPLKAFYFPIKENVVRDSGDETKRIVIGAPACDLKGLDILDKIFLDDDFLDPYYMKNREDTILIGTDCYNTDDSCHCHVFNINPFPTKNADIALSSTENEMVLSVISEKGSKFLSEIMNSDFEEISEIPSEIIHKRDQVKKKLSERIIPNPEETRQGIYNSSEKIWRKFAETCVSCGACSAICPTCHCFLLIDKANFEKIKNWDSCQYPAFERVAGGEDPLSKVHLRLKNRYLCKFIHKPDMIGLLACVGCGRCIDACIGKINKNEVITEICNQPKY
jgi:sulfhydrogenase subunit beta (sulfur reductase)